MLTAQEQYKKFVSFYNIKEAKRNLMLQVDEYFAPNDDLLMGKTNLTRAAYSGALQGELLDTTGSDLIDEYTAFVLGLQFSSDMRWFAINDKNNNADINKVLSKRSDKLHKLLTHSPYYEVLNSLETDVILHGHGALRLEPSETEFITGYTMENYELVIGQKQDNEVKYMSWVEYMPALELLDRFPELCFDTKVKNELMTNYAQKYGLLATYTKKEPPYFMPEDETPENMNTQFMLTYVAFPDLGKPRNTLSAEPDKFININKVEFFKEQTIFPTRDVYRRGSAYGLGIGRKALPKSRIVNKIMYAMLKLSGQKANPARVQHPAITAEAGQRGELQEGQVLTASQQMLDGTDPAKLVTLLNTTGDLNHIMQIYQLVQAQLVQLLPTASSIYKVARQSIQEIEQRLTEQNKRLQPLRKRFLREGPMKHLRFAYNVAEDQGKFNHEEYQLPEGVEVDFTVDLSLLESFKQAKILRAAQALGVASNFISLQPSAADNINGDKAMETAFAAYQVLELLETRAEVAKKRAVQKKQIEQQQALAMANQSAGTDVANSKILDNLTRGQNV